MWSESTGAIARSFFGCLVEADMWRRAGLSCNDVGGRPRLVEEN
jgi:hypothetical protein